MSTQEAISLANVFLKNKKAKGYHVIQKSIVLKPNSKIMYYENGHTIVLSSDSSILVTSDIAIFANTQIQGVDSKSEVHSGNVFIQNNSLQTSEIKLLNIKYN